MVLHGLSRFSLEYSVARRSKEPNPFRHDVVLVCIPEHSPSMSSQPFATVMTDLPGYGYSGYWKEPGLGTNKDSCDDHGSYAGFSVDICLCHDDQGVAVTTAALAGKLADQHYGMVNADPL